MEQNKRSSKSKVYSNKCLHWKKSKILNKQPNSTPQETKNKTKQQQNKLSAKLVEGEQ